MRDSIQLNKIWQVLPAIVFLVVFFVMPLLNNVSASLTQAAGRADYVRLLTDPFYLRVIATTVALSLGVTMICLLAGYPVAYYMVREKPRWSGVWVFLLMTPLLTPIIMRSFGWQVLLSRAGLD